MQAVCHCGKVCKNQHGLKIHQAKSGCKLRGGQKQRTGFPGETGETSSQDSNHSIGSLSAPVFSLTGSLQTPVEKRATDRFLESEEGREQCMSHGRSDIEYSQESANIGTNTLPEEDSPIFPRRRVLEGEEISPTFPTVSVEREVGDLQDSQGGQESPAEEVSPIFPRTTVGMEILQDSQPMTIRKEAPEEPLSFPDSWAVNSPPVRSERVAKRQAQNEERRKKVAWPNMSDKRWEIFYIDVDSIL